jgi:4-amino-4-deoxy-L-arabinose transferase-like glycosyltransferase
MKKKIKQFFQKDKNVLIFLLILSFIIRLVMFLKTGIQTGIAAKNILIAEEIIKNPNIILGLIKSDILPLYHILLSFLILIFRNPIITAKTLSLIIGTATIIPFYLFVKIMFNKKIAVWSSLIFVVYLLHIKYSALALSNTLLIFLILYGSYYFFRNLKKYDKKSFIFSFIFIGLACLLSYISWIIFLFFLILLIVKKRKKETLKYMVIPLLIIVFILSIRLFAPLDVQNSILEKNVYFLNNDIIEIKEMHEEKVFLDQYINLDNTLFYGGSKESFYEKVKSLLTIISITFNPLIIVFGLIGIIFLLIHRNKSNYLILLLLVLSFYIYKQDFNLIYNQTYYSLLIGILFIPLAVKGIFNITKKQHVIRKIILVVLIIVSSYYFIDYYDNLGEKSEIEEISGWVKNNTKDSSFLISNKKNQMWTIILYSEKDYSNFKEIDFIPNVINGKYVYKVFPNRNFEKDTEQLHNKLIGYMENKRPGYIIYANDSNSLDTFKKIENFGECKSFILNNININCINQYQNYVIYKLTY